ncbi:lipin [Anaeramoeba ignava]|uniref:Lipin n=1 Tax=Anaeramoeba ignava TaxID=1746090 RepID=A0A9Q0L7S0_ANAIG|nr:lipin [Anaeramoeba ignava]
MNIATFSVSEKRKLSCSIFLWNYDDKIVISDIDGTITKSDVLGIILPLVSKKDWSWENVAPLFSRISDKGYKFLYLSSRAIGTANFTRNYIRNLTQEKRKLPLGPVIVSPDTLFKAILREVLRKSEQFKVPCVKNLGGLFPSSAFYAGFGNRESDTKAYQSIEISDSRIFIISDKGNFELPETQKKIKYFGFIDYVDLLFK